MKSKLIEANPLVEETRNQVVIKRGPVVYCLESEDMPKGKKIFDVVIPASTDLKPEPFKINGQKCMSLVGNIILTNEDNWNGKLYKEVSSEKNTAQIRFIPYYAWGNRGKGDMTVWIPVSR